MQRAQCPPAGAAHRLISLFPPLSTFGASFQCSAESISPAKIRIPSNRSLIRQANSPMMLFRRSTASACALLGVLMLGTPTHGQSGADFKGETISIQIGYGPGGGYDTYGRARARHFGRSIPGNPS